MRTARTPRHRRALAAATGLALAGGVTFTALPTGASAARAAAAVPTCFGEPATIVGTPGRDVIEGTRGPDVIVGLGGRDVLRGLGARDRICGNAGDDRLIGDLGSDRLRGGNGSDELFGTAPGQSARFDYDDSASFSDQDRPVVGSLRGADTVRGAAVDIGKDVDVLHGIDLVHGSPRADRLRRGAEVRGGGGADALDAYEALGGPGDDVIKGSTTRFGVGGPGDDRIVLSRRGAAAKGKNGDDVVITTGANAELGGGDGHDVLRSLGLGFVGVYGSPGRDDVYGGPGREYVESNNVLGKGTPPYGRIDLGANSDYIDLDAAPESLDLGPGRNELSLEYLDSVSGEASGPVVDVAAGTLDLGDGTLTIGGEIAVVQGSTSLPNVLHGSAGRERLLGGGEDDVIDGRKGDDVVVGGGGDDRLDGGPGTDLISFESQDKLVGPGPHVVDLGRGTASLNGSDEIEGFEDVTGSGGSERLIGDAGPNRISGGQLYRRFPTDELRGLGGDDRLVASSGAEAGTRADGGEGTDTCLAATVVRCEREADRAPID